MGREIDADRASADARARVDGALRTPVVGRSAVGTSYSQHTSSKVVLQTLVASTAATIPAPSATLTSVYSVVLSAVTNEKATKISLF